ncbi:MAG: DUF2155 domain-containing protein [Alphaproteobacteria bacterium]|nr:DUF2155 domain-containing protein [Alphaproteobacteria bacterium]
MRFLNGLGIILLMGMITFPVLAEDIPTKKAVLRGVDKITGRIKTMQADVGNQITFGNLVVDIVKCYTRPPEETPENSAYLNIVENLNDGKKQEVFSGWMFSSNPALSAMEHPVYDVWVIGCKNEAVPAVKTLSEVEKDIMVNLVVNQDATQENEQILNLED